MAEVTTPRTAAGRRHVSALVGLLGGEDWWTTSVLAIEAEARAGGAEEALDGWRAVLGLEIPGERMSKNHLDAAIAHVEEHIGRKARAAALDEGALRSVFIELGLFVDVLPDSPIADRRADPFPSIIDALRERSEPITVKSIPGYGE